MGYFHLLKVCELVGTYILSQLNEYCVWKLKCWSLQRRLGIFRNLLGPEVERKRKAILYVLKEFGLSRTTKANLEVVNFLHVGLDLVNGTYQPYRKPNDNLMYININSNHPPSIKKQIPKYISKRISKLSSNEEIFNSSIRTYGDALQGFQWPLDQTWP